MSGRDYGRYKLEYLAGTAAVLSIISCYGTLLVVAGMSAIGISITLDAGIWAGVVVLFALLAAAGVAIGHRRYRHIAPLLLALVGTAVIA